MNIRHLCVTASLLASTPIFAQEKRETFGITEQTPPFLDLKPDSTYWGRNRLWQGIPSIERAPNGRLWIAWYGGQVGEGKDKNYAVVETSEDEGKTWSRPVFVYDPSRQLLGGDVDSPLLWIDPKGRMWLFVGRVMSAPGISSRTVWGFYTENPDDPKPAWKGPIFAGYGMNLNKPFVFSDGSWMLPVNCLHGDRADAPEVLRNGAHWYKFVDYDKPLEHWGHAKIPDSTFSEHMALERADGSLWMLVRTSRGIARAESKDKGKTWVEVDPVSRDWGVNTRFHLRKLASGNILLVANDSNKRRANLTAMLSLDDGKTWAHKISLDEREFTSYPDAIQNPDGSIDIAYDYGRYLHDQQSILLARITEEDIKAGKLVNPQSFLQRVVNKLADEGGGARYDNEAKDGRWEFEKINKDDPTIKKTMYKEGETLPPNLEASKQSKTLDQ